LQTEIASGAAVDRHLADQLIPFLAVSGGSLRTSEVTPHARSNMYVAERILGVAFQVDGDCVTARPVRPVRA
jgi:RNA 3'-terminal phosphate cyclase